MRLSAHGFWLIDNHPTPSPQLYTKCSFSNMHCFKLLQWIPWQNQGVIKTVTLKLIPNPNLIGIDEKKIVDEKKKKNRIYIPISCANSILLQQQKPMNALQFYTKSTLMWHGMEIWFFLNRFHTPLIFFAFSKLFFYQPEFIDGKFCQMGWTHNLLKISQKSIYSNGNNAILYTLLMLIGFASNIQQMAFYVCALTQTNIDCDLIKR